MRYVLARVSLVIRDKTLLIFCVGDFKIELYLKIATTEKSRLKYTIPFDI